MADGADDAVWRALASSHRRALLDLLARGPRTTGELAGAMDGLSRYAVMQHLGVLEDAGLVVVRRSGRKRFNHLNAVPVQRIYERWVRRLAREPARRALALQRYVEQGEGRTMSQEGKDVRVVHIENEIRLRAPRERVFTALTTEEGKWYPYNYGGERLRALVFEPRVGGQVYEDWGEGMGIQYATVTYYDPPAAVSLRGHLRGGVQLEHWYTFEEDGEVTVLSQSLVAVGPISDDDELGIRTHGDLRKVEEQLRAFVEREPARR